MLILKIKLLVREEKNMDKISFIGVWKLMSFEQIFNDNTISYPYGKKAIGYLIYTIDYVSVHIMRDKRSKCISDDISITSFEEEIEISKNYTGYTGTYTIDYNTSTIIHYPEICSFSNVVNTTLKRKYSFLNSKLVLIDEQPEKKFLYRLVWEHKQN